MIPPPTMSDTFIINKETAMKKIILFLLLTLSVFGQLEKLTPTYPTFWGVSGTNLVPIIPGTTVDTTYTNAVSKITAGSGITITKNSKDYTISYSGAATSGGWTDNGTTITPTTPTDTVKPSNFRLVAGGLADFKEGTVQLPWGEPSGGYWFDGIDDYITITDNDNLDVTSGFTAALFIKTGADVSTFQYLYGKGANGIELIISSGNLIVSRGYSTQWGSYAITANKRYSIIIAHNLTTLQVYVNGVTVIDQAQTTNLIAANSASLRLGASGDAFKGHFYLFRLFNRALTQSEATSLYNNGRLDLAQVSYEDRGASQTIVSTYDTSKTNDTCTVNKYKNIVYTKGSSDSMKVLSNGTLGTKVTASTVFNIGEDDSIVVYGDLTGSEIKYGGCVAEYLGINAGRLGWVESSGNQLSGATSGSPICLNTEQRPMQYRDIKKSIANTATTLTAVIPKGYVIKEIRLKGSGSLTAVKIGTSSGGEQVVASTTASTTASLATFSATANDGYSETADQTLYVEHATAGQTLDVIFKLEKVGN